MGLISVRHDTQQTQKLPLSNCYFNLKKKKKNSFSPFNQNIESKYLKASELAINKIQRHGNSLYWSIYSTTPLSNSWDSLRDQSTSVFMCR